MIRCLDRFYPSIILFYVGYLLLGALTGFVIGLITGAVFLAINIGFLFGLSFGIIANAIVIIIRNIICFKCDIKVCHK